MHKVNHMSITIDEEFRSLIPPLSADEYAQLEENILKDGIRDPLVVWPQEDGTDILLDGHNRWEIFNKHPNALGLNYKRLNFESRDEAIVWVIDNQLGKRNLPLPDKVVLEDKKRALLARQAKERRIEGNSLGGKSGKISCPSSAQTREEKRQNSTDYKIAKAAGTSEDTVRKVRTIKEKATPATWEQVRSGEKSINQAYNEIRNKEIKRPPSAKEYADQAKERHEDFQKQSVVSVTDIRNDQKDKEIIEGEVIRRIKKTLGAINELYVLIDAGEVPVNILSDEGKKIVIRTLAEMQNCIDMIGNIIGKR